MLDHVGSNSSDFPEACAFFATALAPFGIVPVMEEPKSTMLGRAGKPQFRLGGYGPSPDRCTSRSPRGPATRSVVTTRRRSRPAGRIAALPDCATTRRTTPAFVIGHDVEAVCRAAEE